MKKFIGVYDVIGAQIAQLTGFDGLWLGSYQTSLSLGIEDDENYNPNIIVDLCDRIRNNCISLPIIVDVGSGFPNENEIIKFADYCKTNNNIIAICIDDNDSKRTNSMLENDDRKILSTENFVKRINHIKSFFKSDMLFIARTEIITKYKEHTNLEELNYKCNILLQNAANAFLPHYIGSDLNFYKSMCNLIKNKKHLVSIPTGLIQENIDCFDNLSLEIIIYANLDIRIRIRHIIDAYNKINSGLGYVNKLPSATEIKNFIDSINKDNYIL